MTVFSFCLLPDQSHTVVLEIQPSTSQFRQDRLCAEDVGQLISVLLFVLQSSSQLHAGTEVCHLIAPSSALCPPHQLFYPRYSFSHKHSWATGLSQVFFHHIPALSGCKGQRHLREASLLRPAGMDSLQTAFSFCSCDGLALSWLQMRFLPSWSRMPRCAQMKPHC